ncbi:methylated-DNA--[protein]-cysteine S-methyltransferase [Leptolyngbya sp. FACHB-261]|uniref:methylated-DNA--[protein]-cysteine S-methyltransferase n=1 Tax=Leptolyngbya sp. FACHB-261 TaxID=2692806 RepID=UPI0016833186|nr:methylated-DNA--[protein]-cysteine S-methyltransferase [Leptolyngbya sp. FACHB-261]MBD2101490.1 methylated-DNA--[protein]-cysteine S-methyltransferase [Leptolyngbya sp. FACHB-261]
MSEHKEHTVTIGQIETDWGTFGAVLTQKGLSRLSFPDEPFATCETWAKRWLPQAQPQAKSLQDEPRLQVLAEQLRAYLAGELQTFTLPVDLRGTDFQLQVWTALQNVAHGQVQTYGQIASAIGKPKAVRAVGAANGANPVPILVPCHRIIGSNRRLVGFAGGLALKQRLLALEGIALDSSAKLSSPILGAKVLHQGHQHSVAEQKTLWIA